MELPNLPDWLKVSTPHFLAIALVAALLLFGPAPLLDEIGVTGFVTNFRMWIGFALLLSAAIVLARSLASAATWGKQRIRQQRNLSRWRQRLHELTPEESRVLAGYLDGETRTQYFQPTNGIVSGLESETIIYRASNVGHALRGFAYNIQPWALKYLKSHHALLSNAQEEDVDEGDMW